MAPPVISTSTFVMVVRMLAVLCSNSPAIAVQLLRQSKFCVCKCLYSIVLTPQVQLMLILSRHKEGHIYCSCNRPKNTWCKIFYIPYRGYSTKIVMGGYKDQRKKVSTGLNLLKRPC